MRASCPFPWLHLAGTAGAFAIATVWSGIGRKMLWQVRTSDSGREATGVSSNQLNAQRWRRPSATGHLPTRSAPGTKWGTAAAAILSLAASAGATAADCWNEAQDAYERLETKSAMECLETLAADGHTRASLNLGIFLQARGKLMGERSDIDQATELIGKAADAGHIVANGILMVQADTHAAPRSRGSWEYWRRLLKVQEETGGILETLWMKPSLAQMAHFYKPELFADEAAAGARDALMAVALGYWLRRDRHEVTDEMIVSAFERAADAGDVRAAYALKWMYASGKHVRKDRDKSAKYRDQALEGGYPHAYLSKASGTLYRQSREALDGKDEAEKASVDWIRGGSKGDDPRAAYEAATKEALAQARETAMDWLRRGMEHNQSPALMYELGTILDEAPVEGPGGDAKRAQSKDLVRRAAELGHPDAALQLGDWYAEGNGMEKDEHEAGRWYWRGFVINELVARSATHLRYMRTEERKDLVLKLDQTVGERPQDQGFFPLWF